MQAKESTVSLTGLRTISIMYFSDVRPQYARCEVGAVFLTSASFEAPPNNLVYGLNEEGEVLAFEVKESTRGHLVECSCICIYIKNSSG